MMYSIRRHLTGLSAMSHLQLATNSKISERLAKNFWRGSVFEGSREIHAITSSMKERNCPLTKRVIGLGVKPQSNKISKYCWTYGNLYSRDYSNQSSEAIHEDTKTKKSSGTEEVGFNKSTGGVDNSEETEEGEGSNDLDPIEDIFDEEGYGLHLTDEQIQELSNGDPEIIKKIKFIQLEHVVLVEEGAQVPSRIYKFRNWKELLDLDSKGKRRKFYHYLFKTEMTQRSYEIKKKAKREAREKLIAENPLPTKEEDPYGMTYNLCRNTLFLRLYDTTVNRAYNSRVCSAVLHHPPLILDCSYDEFMTVKEAKNCAKQIEYLIAENRIHPEPFNLHLCNANRDSKMMECLKRMVPVMDDDNFILNVHEGCFTELFPKKRIVYLSPHTRDDLEEYDEDDIYVIGAMVDKSSPRPYSLAKAKKLNLTIKRLPLDKYLMWGLGIKSLTVNQMVKIMLDVRYTRGDWKHALKNVPMRKLCRDYHPYPDQIQNQNTNFDESNPPTDPYRKQRKSQVLADNELIFRRKGYRRSDMHNSTNDYNNPKDYKQNNYYSERPKVRAPRVRGLFDDE